MDPLTALSLAGNVIQLIDLSVRIVSKTYRLHKSVSGILPEDEYTITIIKDLSQVNQQLSNSLSQDYKSSELETNEAGLQLIAWNCNKIGTQILARLQLAGEKGSWSKWKSLRQALKQVWSKDEIDDLSKKLTDYRTEMNTRVLVSLRLRLDLEAVEHSSRYETLDVNGRHMLATLKQNHHAIVGKLDDQTRYLSALFISEQQQTREAVRSVTPTPPRRAANSDEIQELDSELHDAVRSQDVVMVRRALKNDKSAVNNADESGQSALHVAASVDNEKIIQLLISRGSDINAEDDDWRTPLHAAVQSDSIDAVRLLLKMGADRTVEDSDGFTARDYTKDSSEMAWIFQNGYEIDDRDSDGCTALHKYVEAGSMKLVQSALSKGADLEARTISGKTPLLVAVIQCRTDITEALLVYGADVDTGTDEGSAVHYATEHEILKLLVNHGANVNILAASGRTALALASRTGLLEKVQILLANGADTNLKDANGESPLHLAVRGHHTQIVLELCKKGLQDSPVSSRQSRTALIEACISGDTGIVKVLLQYSPLLEDTDDETLSPLCRAAQHGHVDVVKLLFDAGKARSGDNYDVGPLPLYHACANNHIEVLRYLVKSRNKAATAKDKGILLQTAVLISTVEMVKVVLDEYFGEGITPSTEASQAMVNAVERREACQADIVSSLLAHGAPVNAHMTGGKKYPVLALAAMHGDRDVVQLLLEHKDIDVNATCTPGWTALNEATARGYLGIVKDLVQAGADVNKAETVEGRYNPMHRACRSGNLAIANFLLDTGKVNVNQRSANGATPLIEASYYNYPDIVASLLKAGADPDVTKTDHGGHSSLSFAAQHGRIEVVKLLIHKGRANVNLRTAPGWTPLMEASNHRRGAVVRELLENGADVHASSNENRTAMDYARSKGYTEIISVLSRYASAPPTSFID